MMKIKLICFYILLTFLSTISYAEKDKLSDYLSQLSQLEKEVEKKIEANNLENSDKIKDQLKKIIEGVLEEQKKIDEEIKKSKELLTSIEIKKSPDEESKETSKENGDDKVIQKEKKELESKLDQQLSNLKKTRLIETKAKDLISRLSEGKTKEFTGFILGKDISPLAWYSLSKAQEELFNIQGKLLDTPLYIAIAILLTLTLCFQLFGTKLLRFYWQQRGVEGNDFKFKVLATSTIAVFITIATYYRLFINDGSHPYIFNLVLLICFSIIAPITYYLLGKIEISPIEELRYGETIYRQRWLSKFIIRVVRLTLILSPFVMAYGYVILGAYLIFNITITSSLICIFLLLRQIMEYAVSQLDSLSQGFRNLIIVVIEFTLGILCIVGSLLFWGVSLENYSDFYGYYKTGIRVGDITINFHKILQSIAIFTIIIIAIKSVQWFLRERVFKRTGTDKGLSEAISSIIGYVGFTIAVVTTLASLGFNTENLALVAGALSLGIGFGLQNIINNFVSGLILLFERPVKAGDWIVVNGVEGLIKKIRVRSTEIETFQRASVIVPNSDLIAHPIQNWTFRDPVGRIEIPIGVAYGSDTELVKKLLIEVADQHPAIRKLPTPKVYFMDFADSCLLFELRCFARDISDRISLSSDLRFMIDASFREHNISIPFPQRDVHIVKEDQ